MYCLNYAELMALLHFRNWKAAHYCASISCLVDRLVRRGLVQRTIAEDDARARLVTLSKEGRLIQKQAGGAYHKVLERRILDRLDAGELEEMTTWLRRIAAG